MLKGGAFYISESSNVMFKNCSISGSKAQFGSIFFIVENYKTRVIIEGSRMENNFGLFNLNDLGQTYLEIRDSSFRNNSNNLFYLIASTLNISNSTLKDNKCSTTNPGCLISAIDYSLILIKNSLVRNISSDFEEGLIYLEKSSLENSFLQMEGLKTKKRKGSCFSLHDSNLTTVFSNFSNYDYNCVFASQSQITLSDSTLNNSEFLFSQINEFGALYCVSCKKLVISNTVFVRNRQITQGSAVYAYAKQDEALGVGIVENSSFLENQAEKGTVFVYNQNFTIIGCKFIKNSAKIGGALFFDNFGNFFVVKQH